jgi:hypothetical protein
MARVSVTTEQIVHAGVLSTLTAPTVDGDVIDCGRVFLEVDNGSGAAVTVTVRSTASTDGLDVEDLAVSVAAGATKKIGPFNVSTFGRSSTDGADQGRAYVDYSAVASVTRGVFGL